MDFILCSMLVRQNDNLTITLYKEYAIYICIYKHIYTHIHIYVYIFQLNTKEARRTLNTNEKEKRQ